MNKRTTISSTATATAPVLSGRPSGSSQSVSGTQATFSNKTHPTHDQIAKRAYEIWIAKGRPSGRDMENWQQAERELIAQFNRSR